MRGALEWYRRGFALGAEESQDSTEPKQGALLPPEAETERSARTQLQSRRRGADNLRTQTFIADSLAEVKPHKQFICFLLACMSLYGIDPLS